MRKSARLQPALLALALALFIWPACNCGSPGEGDGDGGIGPVPECVSGVDFDNDNYGDGCPAGEDCDDYDPTVNTNCPDANCAAGIFQGCACDPVTDPPVSCYDGPAGTSGNAPCMKGMRSCDPITSTWSACGGQVLPELEVCDDGDNDCDGEIDEGVQSACGNCIPGCDSTGVDTDPFPLPMDDPDIGGDGVGVDPNGDLVLDSSTIENHFLWIANDREGTVSKIDTRTGQEVARYASVTHDVLIIGPGATNAVATWNQDTAPATPNGYADNRPSRTAVDFRNDVWVANRAHDTGGLQASATKIYNVEADCTDRNGNMTIDTSKDVNGDGVIDISDPTEFFGEADECIAFTVSLGPVGGVARAVAISVGIDPGDPGNAWVGMYSHQAFYEIDGRTGVVLQRVPPTGAFGDTLPLGAFNPYGAAIDSQGRLWGSHGTAGGKLLRINTAQNPAPFSDVSLGVTGAYGVTVDLRDRVWVAGLNAQAIYRYDPATNMTVSAAISHTSGQTLRSRGVGIDTLGNIWAALDQPTGSPRVVRIDADSATQTGIWDIGGTIPVGVGVDFDGHVWTVNQSTSNASRLWVDSATGEPSAGNPNGQLVQEFPVGPNPYTYSDFTGLGARVVTRGSGDYTVPIKGCSGTDEATWLSVDWDATTPANTSVEIYVQVGNDKATLDQQQLYGPWTTSPADLQNPPGPVPDGQWMLLTIRLISQDRESTPIVHAYNVEWGCPGDPIP